MVNDADFHRLWVDLLTVFQKADIPPESFDSDDDYRRYIADRIDKGSATVGTLAGVFVKSLQEKRIADWLWVNSVQFDYERQIAVRDADGSILISTLLDRAMPHVPHGTGDPTSASLDLSQERDCPVHVMPESNVAHLEVCGGLGKAPNGGVKYRSVSTPHDTAIVEAVRAQQVGARGPCVAAGNRQARELMLQEIFGQACPLRSVADRGSYPSAGFSHGYRPVQCVQIDQTAVGLNQRNLIQHPGY